jgi:hypothetical protein
MKRYPLLFALSLLFLMACSEQPSGPANGEDALGKAVPMDLSDTDIDLRDRYIVVFKKSVGNVDELVDQMTRGNGSTVHYRYRHAIKGFCATIPPQALEGIQRNPNVDYIEADGPMFANPSQSLPSNGSLWGLDRIDQRDRPLDYIYIYPNTASEVTAYIIDTGIRYDHVEFGGRAVFGYDAFGGTGADGNGHGTHVAGTVGGVNVGVAKGVALVAVRVLNDRGSGTTSGVIAGVDWVANNHVDPAVANMSLGGGASTSLDQAVANAVGAGVTFVVAAGNDNKSACNYSPAREPSAITVGSTTSSDARSSFSNFGSCLDLFAPGSSIYSAYKNSSSSYATLSGTSMASPHVAGVVALYLEANTSATPAQVATAITGNATSGKVTSAGTSSPNLLLYNGFIGGGTPSGPNAPTGLSASYSSPNINLSWTDNSTDETGFYIERSVNGGLYAQIAFVSANATTYADGSGFTSGYTYAYRVRAYNTNGNSAYCDPASVTFEPAAPTMSSVLSSEITSSSITVRWGDVFGETSYVVERSPDGNTWGNATTLAAGTTSYNWTGLTPDTEYYFRVKAVNAGGSSSWSNSVSATTLSAPSGVAYISAASTSSINNGNKWTAEVSLTVMDGSSTATGGSVSYTYSGGASGSGTATISASGVATFSVSNIAKNKASVDFDVTGVSGTTNSYNSGSNTVTFPVTVYKP